MRYIVAAVLFAAASLAYWYMIPTFAIRWVAVSGLCVLGAGLLGSHVWRGRVLAPSRADWAGMAFIGWITLSLAWSSDQQAGAYQLMYIAMMYGVFLTVEHGLSKWRETLPDLICVIFAGALALLGWENRVHGGFGNPNWAVEWLLIASPFVALRKWAWPLLVLAVVYMLWFNNSKAEFIALWLVAVFGLLLLRWWITAPIVFIAPFTAAALWPEMVTDAVKFSIISRVELWLNSTALWLESPLIGHGLGSYDVEYPRMQEAHLAWFDSTIFSNPVIYAGAAHNEPLQVLTELGAIGLILTGLFIWSLGIRRWGAPQCALLIAMTLSLFSFPLQNPATAILVVISLGLVAADSRSGAADRRIRNVRGIRHYGLRPLALWTDGFMGVS